MNKELARGYIASGKFREHRYPQHIQNQIIKNYCDTNNLSFVLSRAEYFLSNESQNQLWAALLEGIPNIIFCSIWQLPINKKDRVKIYEFCVASGIKIHFAVESLILENKNSAIDIENLILISESISNKKTTDHLVDLKDLLNYK